MPKVCNAENCCYPVFAVGYCKKHQYLREDAVKQKLNRFSKKRMKVNQLQYNPAAKEFVKEYPLCNIKSPVCTGKAQCVNHRKGKKTEYELLNVEFWESSCYACNNYIEDNDQWARENGHKLNTFN